jgi:hypothetical protein
VVLLLAAPAAARADVTDVPGAVDYDAPDPDRTVLNHARAIANFTFGNYAVFQINWLAGHEWGYVTRSSITQVLRSGWQFDYDPLEEDLLSHPLQGSLDFTAARAAGLSFWESVPYTALGSLEWDYLAERQVYYPGGWRSKPSTNDFVTTATAGILLGEVLYRLSSAILDDTTSGGGRLLRELGAAVVSPMRGLDRLYTGRAWRSGPPPERIHPLWLALDVGVDRLRADQSYDPTALVAVDVQYGDLLPAKARTTLDPFEQFEVYAALNVADSKLSGAQVYGQGLLYGWSLPVSRDEGPERDNDVFGFVQTFDYQGANIAQYGAMSVGFGNFVEWRYGEGRSLRLGADVDWMYLAGLVSPLANPDRGYDFSMGGAAGLSGRLRLGRAGELSLRSRNYLGAVIDGQAAEEVVGYGRLAYDIDVVPHVGVGAAPAVIYRASYGGRSQAVATSLETQLYLRIRN